MRNYKNPQVNENGLVQPSGVPRASDIRRAAREALGGKWKTALKVAAVVCLAASLLSLLLNLANDWYVLSNMNAAPEFGEEPRSLLLDLLTMVVNLFTSALYAIVLARIARAAAGGTELNFSALRFEKGGVFKAVRVELVLMWRAAFLPLLIGTICAGIAGALGSSLNESEGIRMIFVSAVLIVVTVVIFMRMLYYAPIYQMAVICPEASAREIGNRTKAMMKGQRWRLFCLNMSFFGWNALLVLINLLAQRLFDERLMVYSCWIFISNFMILPLNVYMQTALAVFVNDLLARR